MRCHASKGMGKDAPIAEPAHMCELTPSQGREQHLTIQVALSKGHLGEHAGVSG